MKFSILDTFMYLNEHTYSMSPKNVPPSCDHSFRQILTNFYNSLSARMSVKFPTKQFITLPTAPKMCCRTTSRTFSVQIWCIIAY